MEITSKKEAKKQGLKYYFTGKPCKHGHSSERFVGSGHCRACMVKKSRKYRDQNKEKIAERNRKYQEQNKELIAESRRKHYEKNKGEIAEYYKQNKEKIAEYRKQNKKKIAESNLKWRKANPEQVFIRNSLNRCMDNFAGKRARAEKLIGYTYEQLHSHIESQFKDGMSWENRSEWHIDHIKPIKAFLDEGITDPKIINALDNLQPLWAHENLSKGAKHDE